jgi:regulation of enolase protein 1 (concanavalin A-like superfamily)
VVVTNAGYSDWSTQDVASTVRDIWLRVRREGSDYLVTTSSDEAEWTQLRLAHLAEADGGGEVHAGIYACSPKDAGFCAEFDLLEIRANP